MKRWRLFGILFVWAGCNRPAPAPVPALAAPAQTQAANEPVPPNPDQVADPVPKADPHAQAVALAHEVLILDGHIDVPWRLHKARAKGTTVDVGGAAEDGDFDYPRARAGGLDAPFMSIYVSPDFEMKGADAVAEELIAIVESIADANPNTFALAPTVASVKKNFADGKISLPMGMENGAPLMGKLSNVAHFHARGIRYITLAHSKDNHISDSSYDKRHKNGGLSKFGKKVVAEMNRVGIMIDVSHISDDAFWQVMDLSQAPVIASHSSCRHFTPGFERNMSDPMIEALAANGGVIQINFGSGFLDGEVRATREDHQRQIDARLADLGTDEESDKGREAVAQLEREQPSPRSNVAKVADHIEHVIALVGVDHVGLGSDFDGVGDSLPQGLRSVADYPNLIEELLRRGLDRTQIEKIASGNVLRVWAAVEARAATR